MPNAQRLLARLSASLGKQTATQELRWMCEAVAKSSGADTGSDAKAGTDLEQMIARRLRGEPLQYILGTQPFGPLELRVRAPVLIPRPETEHWAMRLHELLRDAGTNITRRSSAGGHPHRMLDLCTGSGCIPLLLCRLAKPGSLHALGVDVSPDAVALATENAELTNIPRSSDSPDGRNSFSLLQADIMSPNFISELVGHRWGPFDIITANPPYIPLSEYKMLDRSVREYEDKKALLGDPDPTMPNDGQGLTFYRTIARLVRSGSDEGSPELLKNGGIVALEVGHNQAPAVRELMEATAGVQKTEVWEDPWGIERTVVCWK